MMIIKVKQFVAIGFFSIQLVSASYADTVKQVVIRTYKGTHPALYLSPNCALGNRGITSSKGLAWLGKEKLKGNATVLNLTGNKLVDLDGLEEWKALRRLIVSYNSLVLLPDVCGGLPLEEIDVTCNLLTGLPDLLRGCTTLKVLKLARNLLGDVPAVVLTLSALEELDVSCNGISELPDLTAMKALKKIILDDGVSHDRANSITHLPESLEDMATQLEIICVGRLSLDEPSKTMLRRMEEKNEDLVVHRGILTEDTFRKRPKAHFTGGKSGGGAAVC